MELKKDSNAVAIDMLLIVHSEKRRAAQTTQLDSQEDPSALLQNRGGNARLAQGLLRSRGTSTTRPRGLPAGGRPERGQPKPLPQGCLCPDATAPVSLGNAQQPQPRGGCPRLTPHAGLWVLCRIGSPFPPVIP